MHRAMIEKCISLPQNPLLSEVFTFFIIQMEPFKLSVAHHVAPNHL